MLNSFFNKSRAAADTEKQKDYRNIVFIQIIIIVFGLTLSGHVIEDTKTPEAKLVITIFSIFGLTYSFLLWDLLRNFTNSKTLIRIYLLLLFGSIGVGLLVEFPYYTFIDVPDRRIILLLVHAMLFVTEVIIISFAIRDIFSGEYLTPDKLWGSACVFLMIGISFGSLYDLICLIKPGSLNPRLAIGFPNYSECVTYSLAILGGMDPGQPEASRLIRNIGILEAVWGNLFVVLVIGKLMGLPRPPKPGDAA
ncbi:hypothetical protein [Pseudochryseolinea flava]|uniref:Two pore domain potassium channel family protein n=1 Tax=Pseudochryseolinea flava TaxID=2059302 RepID=A0A364Y025_9BACT|nr:hypothetical protein [Pseudochryseolinea flava]RAV99610.1 hypothetical protein DQQ10_18595 [Pseudochryseolinea flava]